MKYMCFVFNIINNPRPNNFEQVAPRCISKDFHEMKRQFTVRCKHKILNMIKNAWYKDNHLLNLLRYLKGPHFTENAIFFSFSFFFRYNYYNKTNETSFKTM